MTRDDILKEATRIAGLAERDVWAELDEETYTMTRLIAAMLPYVQAESEWLRLAHRWLTFAEACSPSLARHLITATNALIDSSPLPPPPDKEQGT